MSTAVSSLFDLDFMSQNQNRNLLGLSGSTANQNRLNTARQISFQGSPFIPQTKTSPLPRPAHIDMCFPPMTKPVGHSLPTQSSTAIAPPTFPLQRRDSVKSDSSQGSAAAVESTRYKTELCRPFEETGHCRYGAKCQFAHGMLELRNLNRHPKYKTELCRTFHTTGFCTYGQRCNFIHNDEERRVASHSDRSQSRAQRPRALVLPPPIAGSTAESPCSSINGDSSPSQSPGFLNDDVFASLRLSPTPSFGSDCSISSSCGSLPSPPHTPSQSYEHTIMTSPLDLGLNLPVFSRLNL